MSRQSGIQRFSKILTRDLKGEGDREAEKE